MDAVFSKRLRDVRDEREMRDGQGLRDRRDPKF